MRGDIKIFLILTFYSQEKTSKNGGLYPLDKIMEAFLCA